jgi:hypothetical protein
MIGWIVATTRSSMFRGTIRRWRVASVHESRAAHRIPEVGSGGAIEVEAVQQLGGTAGDLLAREVVEAPNEIEVLSGGEAFLDGGVLTGEPDPRPHTGGFGGNVESSRTTVVLPAPLGPSRP